MERLSQRVATYPSADLGLAGGYRGFVACTYVDGLNYPVCNSTCLFLESILSTQQLGFEALELRGLF